MVICKFFLQNRCNFGDRCKFEHVYPDEINQSQRRQPSNHYESGRKGNTQATVYSNYNQREYNQRDYNQRDYNQRDYNQRDYNQRDYNQRDYNQRDYNQRDNYREHNQKDYSYREQNQRDYNQGSPRGRPDNRYHYVRNNNTQPQRFYQQESNARVNPQQQSDSSLDEVYSVIKYEVNQMEQGNMWTLTSFGPIRHLGSFPGWYDYSTEEIRWAAYAAHQQNTQEKYSASVELLTRQAKLLRDKLRISKPVDLLEQYLRQKADTIHPLEADVFRLASTAVIPGNTFSASSFTPSTTEAEMEDSPVSTFPASSNLFGSVPTAQTSNFFGSVPTAQTSNIFGSVQSPATNLFGSVPPSPHTNIFGSVQQRQQTGFGSAPSTNIFGIAQGGTFTNSQQSSDSQSKLEFMDEDLDYKILSVMWKGDDYSDPKDLTDEEMAQFKADKFTYGQVPIVPPPKELC